MNERSKIILWAINLMACADSSILDSLSGRESYLPLLIYRIAMPLAWGLLWVAYARASRNSSWNEETRKRAWRMLLMMLVLNVLSVSVSINRWGNLAVYSLILIGLYLGKIVERKLIHR